jgi:hypothetical protein
MKIVCVFDTTERDISWASRPYSLLCVLADVGPFGG